MHVYSEESFIIINGAYFAESIYRIALIVIWHACTFHLFSFHPLLLFKHYNLHTFPTYTHTDVFFLLLVLWTPLSLNVFLITLSK